MNLISLPIKLTFVFLQFRLGSPTISARLIDSTEFRDNQKKSLQWKSKNTYRAHVKKSWAPRL